MQACEYDEITYIVCMYSQKNMEQEGEKGDLMGYEWGEVLFFSMNPMFCSACACLACQLPPLSLYSLPSSLSSPTFPIHPHSPLVYPTPTTPTPSHISALHWDEDRAGSPERMSEPEECPFPKDGMSPAEPWALCKAV